VIPTLAEESFEGGHMFWRNDTDEVYIIYDRQRDDGVALLAGRWDKPPWKWDNSDQRIGITPPPGRVEPVRGFGWLWRTQLGGPDSLLGWALDKEYGFDKVGRVQSFEKGLAFKGSTAKVYALLSNSRFLAYDPSSGQKDSPTSPSYADTGFRPAPIFERPWQQLGEGSSSLGYPLGAALTNRNYARQYFERGFMFWWAAPQAPQPIWVIYTPAPGATQGFSWNVYDNLWQAGQPEYPADCPEAIPPLGPKAGFGLVWCHQRDVKAQLGPPREAEFGSADTFPKGAVQYFQNGLMLENPADKEIWMLINEGGWQRVSY
jgi:hypothetical protein